MSMDQSLTQIIESCDSAAPLEEALTLPAPMVGEHANRRTLANERLREDVAGDWKSQPGVESW